MREEECRALLTRLLDDSRVQWEQYGVWTRFRFREGSMVWELSCRCMTGEILIYSRYPFNTLNRSAALEACNKANRRLMRGALFLQQNTPAFRITADLHDPYNARERLAEALEYSTAAVIKFWTDLQIYTGGR